MARSFALLAAATLTACSGASTRQAATTRPLSREPTRLASVEPDPCGLPADVRLGARAEIDPLPFALASLPLSVKRDAVAALPEPIPGAPEAADLVVHALPGSLRSALARPSELVPRSGFGSVEMGIVPATFECSGDQSGHTVPLYYTTLIPHGSGSAEYVMGDAWFDQGSCKTMLDHREGLLATALVGKLIYAAREAPAEGARADRLTLFLPVATRIVTEGFDARDALETFGRLTRLSIPLQRGAGVSVLATFDIEVLDAWLSDGAETNAGAAYAKYGERELTIGLEVTQSVGDPEPVGLVYVERSTSRTFARTRVFGCAPL